MRSRNGRFKMKKINLLWLIVATTILLATGTALAQAQKSGADIDVQHYKIDAELIPASQVLRARAEVTFTPQTDTRSVIFEMNGSLTIKRIIVKDGALPGSTSAAPAPVSAPPPSSAPRRSPQSQTANKEMPAPDMQ